MVRSARWWIFPHLSSLIRIHANCLEIVFYACFVVWRYKSATNLFMRADRSSASLLINQRAFVLEIHFPPSVGGLNYCDGNARCRYDGERGCSYITHKLFSSIISRASAKNTPINWTRAAGLSSVGRWDLWSIHRSLSCCMIRSTRMEIFGWLIVSFMQLSCMLLSEKVMPVASSTCLYHTMRCDCKAVNLHVTRTVTLARSIIINNSDFESREGCAGFSV